MNPRLLIALLLLSSCYRPPADGPIDMACNAATCDGCCDTAGKCRVGSVASACGSGGAVCVDCGAYECGAGVCVQPPDPDAGSFDAGEPDAGAPDAGLLDAGLIAPGIISNLVGSQFQAEPSVAATATGTVAAAWMEYTQAIGRYQIAYRISQDNGQTFATALRAATPAGLWGRSPIVSATADGVWLTWVAIHIDANGQRDDVQVLSSHAAAGANAFDAPISITDSTVATPRYNASAIGLPSNALVVAYEEIGRVNVAHHDANGTTRSVAISRTSGLPALCAGDGRMFLVFMDSAGISLRASDDEGLTWPAASEKVISHDARLASAAPHCAVAGSNVWVVYGLTNDAGGTGQTEELTEVMVAVSTDGAQTFTSSFDVKPATTPLAVLPQIAASKGSAYVAFYSGAQATDDLGNAMVVRIGAAGPLANVVARTPIHFSGDRQLPLWLGDAFGLYASGGRVHLAYGDNSSTATRVGYWAMEGLAIMP